jgi:putative mRNA 3-end processing factor
MEATYGSPTCKRSFNADVKKLLVSMVNEGLKQGTVYVFGYHGKLQEVMQILHDADIKVPFVAPERVFHVSMICQKHGMHLGRLMLSEEKEAREILERNSPCVAFYHMNSGNEVNRGVFRIYVSGWEFYVPCRELAKNEYVIALSDHSDFDGLMEYVRRSKPRFVVTDNFRVGHAETLAKEIRKNLGIRATALPKK